jgi:hypothetical protein
MSYLDMSVKELEQRLEDFKAEIAAEPTIATRQRAYLRRSDRIANTRQALVYARIREAK